MAALAASGTQSPHHRRPGDRARLLAAEKLEGRALRRARLPVHPQSGLLGRDHGKPDTGHLRLSRLYGHRRADRDRHRPSPAPLRRAAADPRSDADPADLRLSHSGDRLFRHRHGAGIARDRHLRSARPDPPDPSRDFLDPDLASGGGRSLRRDRMAKARQGRTPLRDAADHGRSQPDDHALALDGRRGGPCRRRRAGCSGRALNQVNTALGFESGFIIVVVAIMLDRVLRIGRARS